MKKTGQVNQVPLKPIELLVLSNELVGCQSNTYKNPGNYLTTTQIR